MRHQLTYLTSGLAAESKSAATNKKTLFSAASLVDPLTIAASANHTSH